MIFDKNIKLLEVTKGTNWVLTKVDINDSILAFMCVYLPPDERTVEIVEEIDEAIADCSVQVIMGGGDFNSTESDSPRDVFPNGYTFRDPRRRIISDLLLNLNMADTIGLRSYGSWDPRGGPHSLERRQPQGKENRQDLLQLCDGHGSQTPDAGF